LGNGYLGRTEIRTQTNAIFADPKGYGHLRVTLSNEFAAANGQAFMNLDQWDEIHLAFHANNQAYGPTPTQYYWTQMIFPFR
jgi:hypothetical protein